MTRTLPLAFLSALILVACPSNNTPQNDARVDSTVTTDSRVDAPMCVRGGVENTLALCSDGCDNGDDEGGAFADCEDRDCCRVRTNCGANTYCGRSANDGGRDSSTDASSDANLCSMQVASGGENTLALCSNGCSDDGDRFVDCDDFDCCSLTAPVRTDCPTTSSCYRRLADAGLLSDATVTDSAASDAGASDTASGDN